MKIPWFEIKCTLLALAALAVFALAGCANCRTGAIADATRYRDRGYEPRVACYHLNLDGRAAGAFLWSSHCQGQALVDGQWKWIGVTGLRDTSTYSRRQVEPVQFREGTDYFWWSIEDYQKLIDDNPVHDEWKNAVWLLLLLAI